MVSLLSRVERLDVAKAFSICVARIAPSVSLEYDLTSIGRPANFVSEARAFCCDSFSLRGAIKASSFRFASVNFDASISSFPARSLTLAVSPLAVSICKSVACCVNVNNLLDASRNFTPLLWATNCRAKANAARTTANPAHLTYEESHPPVDRSSCSTCALRDWISDNLSAREALFWAVMLCIIIKIFVSFCCIRVNPWLICP